MDLLEARCQVGAHVGVGRCRRGCRAEASKQQRAQLVGSWLALRSRLITV
jgi:hypothetical protein